MTNTADRGGEGDQVEELAKAISNVMELQFPEFTRLKWVDQSIPAKAAYRRRAKAALSTPQPNVDEGDGK